MRRKETEKQKARSVKKRRRQEEDNNSWYDKLKQTERKREKS